MFSLKNSTLLWSWLRGCGGEGFERYLSLDTGERHCVENEYSLSKFSTTKTGARENSSHQKSKNDLQDFHFFLFLRSLSSPLVDSSCNGNIKKMLSAKVSHGKLFIDLDMP